MSAKPLLTVFSFVTLSISDETSKQRYVTILFFELSFRCLYPLASIAKVLRFRKNNLIEYRKLILLFLCQYICSFFVNWAAFITTAPYFLNLSSVLNAVYSTVFGCCSAPDLILKMCYFFVFGILLCKSRGIPPRLTTLKISDVHRCLELCRCAWYRFKSNFWK